MISERIARLNKKVRDITPTICLDRARLATQFYSEPSMEPFILRRARLLEYVLEKKEIFIDEDSILAGHSASRLRAVPLFPEVTAWLIDDLETLDTREADSFAYLPGEKDELREIANLWKGRTFGDLTAAQVDADMQAMMDAGVFTKGISNLSTMNHAPAYDDMVRYGYRHYINKCKENIEAIDVMNIENMEKKITWQALIITMEAIIKFAHRYADLAEKMAADCKDAKRKQELLSMAETCRVVPENPPQNFQQAAQLVWFTHLCIMMEVNGGDHCLGRFDQYMYPFFKEDKKKGITEDFFKDIVQEFKLKIAELWNLRTEAESLADPGCPLWIHMMLGGMLANGEDGCNELTDLVLHCMEDLQTKEPCVSFRYHKNINQDTFRLALAVAREGGSHPAFFSDEIAISHLKDLGFTEEEAREWGICGCIEPVVQGKTDFQSNAGYFNPIKILEITLNNGVDPITNTKVGIETGEAQDFKSIQDVMAAYEKQSAFFVDKFVELYNRIVSIHAYALPTLIGSSFTEGCIEKGRILQKEGANHRYSAMAVSGVANVADSLAAIEECVFDKKYLTMKELMNLLETNFEGKENMRQLLINRAPKFGNDIEEVDKYANWLVELCDSQVGKYIDGRNGQFTTVIASQSYNIELGKLVGATPDGRLAFSYLADNASPSIGMDINGPTAVVNSLGTMDPSVPHSGVLLNQRFDPEVVKGEKGLDIMETVIRTYFDQNGQHIQVNVVDNETLQAAQENPNDYRHILVRVAGYSAFFVDLGKDIQDNIIARTIQTSL